MKSAVHFLVLVVLVGAAIAGDCSKHCQKCIHHNIFNDRCVVCYRALLDDYECKTGAPANCDVAISNTYCYRCSEKFQLNVATGQCIAITIDNCVNGYTDTDNVQICETCSPGSPSADGLSCTTVQQFQNCLWESPNSCVRCKDGYSYDSTKKACVINTLKGCLTTSSSGDCDSCNVFSGWYMTKPGKCAQGTSIEQALKILLSLN